MNLKNKDWQNGPEFLQLPESQWPISSDCNTEELPPEESDLALNIQIDQKQYKISNCMDISRYSSYNKSIRVTRILSVFEKSRKPSLNNLFHSPDADLLQRAELFWINDAQVALKQ